MAFKILTVPMFRYLTFAFILLMAGLAACTTTEQAAERDDEPRRETAVEETEEISNEELISKLNETRSRLSDTYLTQQHDIPEAFLKKDTTDNSYSNPFDGFRIQVLSTRDINLADSVSTEFRLWADSTFANYVPNAYVFFRQPYYKVHIGDFQNRQRANTLSRIIKQKYPEAWVVHDRIDPESVPADTTNISKLREDEENENETQGSNTEMRPK